MPKFAANLSMMFNETPFPERFARAAKAGFGAVEFLFPYDYPPDEVAGWLKTNKLRNVLFNMGPDNVAAKEWGITSLPGREEEFRAQVATAIDYDNIARSDHLERAVDSEIVARSGAHSKGCTDKLAAAMKRS